LNPCGRAVDWIQFPFEVNARVHDGPGAPIVRLRWVYTDQPFLPVGTGCVVNNRVWNEDFYSDLPVGQLQQVIADYVQDARWKIPPQLAPGHICHAEWLPTGEPWPNDLPPQEYTCNDWPICCDIADDCPRGGLALGGSAGDVYHGTDSTSGGMVVGGSTGDSYRPPDSVEGGVSIGGSAGDVYSEPDPAEGGLELGGATGDVYSAPDPTAGGMELGGEVGDIHPEGVWVRDICGFYSFTAEFTGGHRIKLWGAGGRGGPSTSGGGMDLGGGGGGGGGFAEYVVSLTEGVSYDVFVGCGGQAGTPDGDDTTFKWTPLIVFTAYGGTGSVDEGAGVGGVITSDGYVVESWHGGDGADSGPELPGGGAGSSATEKIGVADGTGTDAVGTVGGVAPYITGGNGGDGGPVAFDGNPGGGPGGGGGGAGAGGANPGDGHAGQVVIIWPPGV
jgi:hypothetical protein